jgi:hypothetical protein
VRITTIGFGYVKSLGNYENCKVYLEAQLEPGEDPEESMTELRNRVAEELNLPDQWYDLRRKLVGQLEELEALHKHTKEQQVMLHRAEQAWENFSEFLVAHGVDPEKLTIEDFRAMRAEHSPAPATVELPVDKGDDIDLEQYEYYPVDHDIPSSPEEFYPIPLSPEEF